MFYRYLHVKLRTEGISESNLKKHIRAAEGENYKAISPISVAYVQWQRIREKTHRKRRLEAEEKSAFELADEALDTAMQNAAKEGKDGQGK